MLVGVALMLLMAGSLVTLIWALLSLDTNEEISPSDLDETGQL